MHRLGTLGGALLLVAVVVAASVTSAVAPPLGAAAAAEAEGWTVDRVRFESLDGQPLTVDGVGTYRGTVDVVAAPEGVGVINEVGLEDYVRGISEVPPSWPAEAQKAQAIAARTYALWEWSRQVNATYKNIGADICATDACQVYRGLDRERQDRATAWVAAVDATAGRAIYWRDRPIKAMYSSSNGGAMVAGPEPYLRAGADPDDRWSPLHRWQATYDLRAVVEAAELPPTTVSIHREGDTVWAVSPGESGPQLAALTAADFRKRLNDRLPKAEGLPLALPTVRFGMHTAGADNKGNGTVEVEGIGWGHAIGLSQWGAYGKARRGMKADDILAAYYAGLRSVPVPSSRLPQTIKVAVELGAPSATVAPEAGRFRVVAGDGSVLAHAATGAWTVTPAGTAQVRVTPPADEAGTAPAGVIAVTPETPEPGEALVVRLLLPRPAAVTVVATPPGADPVPIELGVVGPGEVDQALPPARTAGTYAASVQTDPGGGRLAATPLSVDIALPPPPVPPKADASTLARLGDGPGGMPGLPMAVALVLLLGVGGLTARIGRRHLPRLQ